MTVTTRVAAPRRTPMTATRKAALVAGILYLITFVASIPALGLYDAILHDHAFVLGGGSDTSVLWGAFGEVVTALAGIGTAVALYRITRRQSQSLALGFVTSRVLEAAMIFVGVLSLLSIVTLHQDVAGTASAHTGSLLTTGRALVALHDWTFLLGPGLMPAINALCFATILYRSRLVPRIIPTIGLVGAPLLLIAFTAILFGAFDQVSSPSFFLTLPIAAWEFSVGVYMAVKGFRPSPITDAIDREDANRHQLAA
jgi:Domain of unknown function (DUF4386)